MAKGGNMAKKIVAIVSLVIVGLLIFTTIIMAAIKVDYGIHCNAPDAIRVLKPGDKNSADVATDAQYKKIKNLISNSSKESSLTALFNGSLFDHAKVVTDKTTASTFTIKSNCYYVQYVYDDAQKLTEGNKTYKENGKNYYYKELWFEIGSIDEQSVFTVYIIPFYDDNNEGDYNQQSTIAAKHYELTADFESVYNYLTENFK